MYSEFSQEESSRWFNFTEKKFIHNVDTFYYSVMPDVLSWHEDKNVLKMIEELKSAKEKAEYIEKPFYDTGMNIDPSFSFKFYKFNLSVEHGYNIFVAETVPNEKTTPIFVQIRSEYIWLNGLDSAVKNSLESVKALLKRYDINILSVNENRIDFAFHTNYIQDMCNFFKEGNIGKMQISKFSRTGRDSALKGDKVDTDYITFGRRKSDNVFLRIYNKSKEVIEMGYKQFFVPIWLEKGLISEFDKYLFEYCFNKSTRSFNLKEKGRCQFYMEYGRDETVKAEIARLFSNRTTPITDFKAMADGLVPDLTNVVNIEFETKRKFTANFKFPKIEYPKGIAEYSKRLHLILEMRTSMVDFLTDKTIRFVKFKGKYGEVRRDRRPTANWWTRLASCPELTGISYGLCKEYQHKFDSIRYKNISLKNIAKMSSYYELENGIIGSDDTVDCDFTEFLANMNDNDYELYTVHKKSVRKELIRQLSDTAKDPMKVINTVPYQTERLVKTIRLILKNKKKIIARNDMKGLYNQRIFTEVKLL